MAKTGGRGEKMTNEQLREFANMFGSVYDNTNGIKSIFVDTALSTEEKIQKINDLKESTGDSAEYFGNARQLAVDMLGQGDFKAELLDKQLDEFREEYIERFFLDMGASMDEGLKILPAFLKSNDKTRGRYELAQNEVVSGMIKGRAEFDGMDMDKLKAFLEMRDDESPEYEQAKKDLINDLAPKDELEKIMIDNMFENEENIEKMRRDYNLGMLNNISNKVSGQAAKVREADEAERKVRKWAEAVNATGDERLKAEFQEALNDNNKTEVSEDLDKIASKDELEKVKDVYRYKVEGKLKSDIPELDSFLEIIQPVLNQLVIAFWRPRFGIQDWAQKMFVGTDKEPSIVAQHLQDRNETNIQAEWMRDNGLLTAEQKAEFDRALRLGKKDKILTDAFKNGPLFNQLNAKLNADQEAEAEWFNDDANKGLPEYNTKKAAYMEKCANGYYDGRSNLFDQNYTPDESLDIVNTFMKEKLREISGKARTEGLSIKDEKERLRDFFAAMFGAMEKSIGSDANQKKEFLNNGLMGHYGGLLEKHTLDNPVYSDANDFLTDKKRQKELQEAYEAEELAKKKERDLAIAAKAAAQSKGNTA